MSIDPNTIKTHAKTMLSTNLTNEINFQYDSVWGKYFRHLVAASATATEAQQNAFKEAEKIVRGIKRGLKEIQQSKAGKIKLKSARQLADEI